MRELHDNIDVKRGISPAAAATDNTAFVSQILDMPGLPSAEFVILAGALADADATSTVLAEEGDQANLSDNTAVDDRDLLGTEAQASFDFPADKLYSSAQTAFNLLAASVEPTELEVEQAMTEDSEFVNWLATGYNDSDLNWDHENYESEALRRYKKNDVVYLVWLDNTKPRGVDFLLCKNHTSFTRATQYGLIPCKSKESAGQLWEMLRARAGWVMSALGLAFSLWP
jgi:hypothetical protein